MAEGTRGDVYYEVNGIDPIRATRADILIVADDAAGPGEDTLRFIGETLPWRYRIRDVGVGALVLEACVESGVVEAKLELDPRERAFRVVGFGKEYVPNICAFGRIGPVEPDLPCGTFGDTGCE